MPEKRIRLIFGLGNPGLKYKDTRHNLGFMVVDKISETFGIPLNKKKINSEYGKGAIDVNDAILVKPMTFMNKSGASVIGFLNFYKLPINDIVVIHDEIDLDFGRIKIKEKGGDGGHNGIKSIMDALGTGDFCRIRIGIGRSEIQTDVSEYVLSPFNDNERSFLDQIVIRAQDAAHAVLCKGAKEAMNLFNKKVMI